MHAVVLDSTGKDAEFVRRVLRDEEFAPQVTSVRTGQEVVNAVRGGVVDLILAPAEPPDMRFRRLRYALDGAHWDGTFAGIAGSEAALDKCVAAGAHFGLGRPLDSDVFRRALQHFRLLEVTGVPQMEDVEDTWSVALRRPFELGFTNRPIDFTKPGAVWMAEYRGPDGALKALALFDESLGFSLGAAVMLLPPTITREALRQRAASQRLSRNLQMICEMLTDLYPSTNLTLHDLRRTAYLPRTLRQRANAGGRLDLEVDLKAYGRGRAAFVRLDEQPRRPRTSATTTPPRRGARFI